MVVDLLRAGLFSLAHFCGGSMGLAIVVASLGLRALVLPFSIRAARRRLAEPSRTGTPGIAGLAQLPIALGIYSAIRGIGERAGSFLWVRNLARPDRALALLGALVAGGLSWVSASAQTLNGAPAGSAARGVALGVSLLLTAGLTLAALSHMSAGVAVYSITSSLAGFGEQRLIARLTRPKQGSSR
jgi:membrane protein insertase Oxa1/YidC/SpoIIIJ